MASSPSSVRDVADGIRRLHVNAVDGHSWRAPRIAVFNLDIVGTLNPVLPVIAELVAQGCTVHYYLRKECLVKMVEATGAQALTFDNYLCRWEELLAEESEWLEHNGLKPSTSPPLGKSMCLQMLFYGLPAGICLGKRLLEQLSSEETRPDLILYNVQLLHPLLAACKLAVPCASFITYPGPGTPMHLAEIPPEERESWDRDLAAHPMIKQANDIAINTFGLDVLQSQLLGRHYSKQLNLIFSVPELDGVVADYQKALIDERSFLWVGSTGSVDHRANGDNEGESDNQSPWVVPKGTKVLLVSLGTLTVDMRWDLAENRSTLGWVTGRDFSIRIWQELKESFGRRRDLRVILGVGPRACIQEILGDLPENFVAMTWFDQASALDYADAMVTHGGFNSTKEALIAGVPMIVIPFCVDQPSIGEAVERSGAGITFPDIMATPLGKLTDAVSAALWGPGQVQRERSRALGRALQSAGGAERSASACLQLTKAWQSAGSAGA